MTRRIVLPLEPEQRAALEAIAEAEGRSLSDLIRRIIDAWLYLRQPGEKS